MSKRQVYTLECHYSSIKKPIYDVKDGGRQIVIIFNTSNGGCGWSTAYRALMKHLFWSVDISTFTQPTKCHCEIIPIWLIVHTTRPTTVRVPRTSGVSHGMVREDLPAFSGFEHFANHRPNHAHQKWTRSEGHMLRSLGVGANSDEFSICCLHTRHATF